MGYHHLALSARDIAPVLLWKDSGLVRRARQTGGSGEGRKPFLCHSRTDRRDRHYDASHAPPRDR